MMFSTKTKVIFTTLISALTLSTGVLACSLDGWTSSSGSVAVGQPFGATGGDINGVSRFEEFCALEVSGTGYVQTSAPSHTRVRARAYLNPDFSGTGESNVLVAYDAEDGTGVLFTVSWNNGNWEVDASANGGTSGSTASTGGWDLMEFDWNPGSNTLDVYVNADATTDSPTFSVNSGASTTLEAIRIGLPDGHGGGNSGNLYVDSVEMHNETAVGALLNCDADGNTGLNFADLSTMYQELFGGPPVLSPGTPDCDANGGINFADLSTLFAILFP